MRTLLAVLLIIFIAGCKKEEDGYVDLPDFTPPESLTTSLDGWEVPQGPAARQRRGSLQGLTKVIDAFNDDDSPAKIEVGPRTMVVQMATWCPYSRQVVDFLNDPAVQPRLGRHQFVFVFSDDEWPDVERNLQEAVSSGDMDEADLPDQLAALKEDAGHARVYDPEYLEFLPEGSEYYFLPKNSPLWGDSYPLVYDRSTQRFSQKVMDAIGKAFFSERELEAFVDLWIKHLPEADRERLKVREAEASSGS